MKPKSAIKIFIFIIAAYCASVGFGVYRLTSSEAFPLARKALASYLVASNSRDAGEPSHLRWWRSWFYRDGDTRFSLCSQSGTCHAIVGYKLHGKWIIKVDGNLISVNGEFVRVDQWKG